MFVLLVIIFFEGCTCYLKDVFAHLVNVSYKDDNFQEMLESFKHYEQIYSKKGE